VAALLLLFSSFGSDVDMELLTVAVLVKNVPCGVAVGMWTTSVKRASAPLGKVAFVQVTVPLVPTAGWLEQSQASPEFWFIDTKVMPGGNGSLKLALLASSGPELVTSMV
jgi:hypothetical protein